MSRAECSTGECQELSVLQVDVKSSGKTSLQVAAHQGHTEVVRFLLDQGASLDTRDEEGDSPLHYSAFGLFFSLNSRTVFSEL